MPPRKKVIQATSTGPSAAPKPETSNPLGSTDGPANHPPQGPVTRKRQREQSDEAGMNVENEMIGEESQRGFKPTGSSGSVATIAPSAVQATVQGQPSGRGRPRSTYSNAAAMPVDEPKTASSRGAASRAGQRGRGGYSGVGRALNSYVNPEEVATGLPPTASAPKSAGRSKAVKGEPGLAAPPTPVSQVLSDNFDEKSRQSFLLPAFPGSDRGSKGLRHFSAKVCQKVEEKGCTTYNEVADELVAEMNSPKNFDQKNIRRRVYDALNVLMAMGIIRKDRKEIRWCGMPRSGEQRAAELQLEIRELREKAARKQEEVETVLRRLVSVKNLVSRNRHFESAGRGPDPRNQIHLPFLLATAPSETQIQCEMTEDRSEFFFDFAGPFAIHEDLEILSLLRLDTISEEETKKLVPAELLRFLPMDVLKRRDGEVGS